MKFRILFTFLLLMGSHLLHAKTTDLELEDTKTIDPQKADTTKEMPKPSDEVPTSTPVEKETPDVAKESKPDVRTGRTETKTSDLDAENLSKKLKLRAKEKALYEMDNAKQSKYARQEEDSDPELDNLNKEQKLLMMENIVEEERLKRDNAELRATLQRMRWEKEMLNTQLDIEVLKEEEKFKEGAKKHQDKLIALSREVELSEEHVKKLNSQLDRQRLGWQLKTAKLEAEINTFVIEKQRKQFADNKPVYLDNPLVDGDTLVISDRRIELNGLIAIDTADYVTTRINYYNNKDSKKPIFLVIDSSPGGSAMAGYRIIKAMEASKAPVYVVVKSLAASMAAIITTVAENSFAYPNAIIVHHQLSITLFLARLNVTQQKEMYEDSKRWWERMMTPIADKMGITTTEFIEKMYEHSSSGDWSEFGTEAKELKWVNTIVQRIEETSLLEDPDAEMAEEEMMMPTKEVITAEGRAVVYMPHLSPKDAYFVYSPDQYYQMR